MIDDTTTTDTADAGGRFMTEGIDLETWRQREGLSYEHLATHVGLPMATVRRHCLGQRWDATVVDAIIAATGGGVSLFAMHRRRVAWQRAHPRERLRIAS